LNRLFILVKYFYGSYIDDAVSFNDGTVQTWDLEITKTGKIKYGGPDRPNCCCATCEDVQNCVRKTCQEWNGTDYNLVRRNCWAFVGAAKENCCLKHK